MKGINCCYYIVTFKNIFIKKIYRKSNITNIIKNDNSFHKRLLFFTLISSWVTLGWRLDTTIRCPCVDSCDVLSAVDSIPIVRGTGVVGVSRRAFNSWLIRPLPNFTVSSIFLVLLIYIDIQEIFMKSKKYLLLKQQTMSIHKIHVCGVCRQCWQIKLL